MSVVLITPDDLYGEAVSAAVVLDSKAGISSKEAREEISHYCQKNLAAYRRPTNIFFVDQFPLNPTGKIKRPELAAELVQLESKGA